MKRVKRSRAEGQTEGCDGVIAISYGNNILITYLDFRYFSYDTRFSVAYWKEIANIGVRFSKFSFLNNDLLKHQLVLTIEFLNKFMLHHLV